MQHLRKELKTKLLKVSLTLLLSSLPSMFHACWADGPVAVFSIEKDGQTYKVTELVKKEREKISKWNILRLKRGDEYWHYKLIDCEYPWVLSPKDHKKLKKELAGVPDYRPYAQQHPDRQKVSDHYQRWGPVYNTLIGTGIQASH